MQPWRQKPVAGQAEAQQPFMGHCSVQAIRQEPSRSMLVSPETFSATINLTTPGVTGIWLKACCWEHRLVFRHPSDVGWLTAVLVLSMESWRATNLVNPCSSWWSAGEYPWHCWSLRGVLPGKRKYQAYPRQTQTLLAHWLMAVKAGLAVQGYALSREEQQKTTSSFIDSACFGLTQGSAKSQLTTINLRTIPINQSFFPISIHMARISTLPLNLQQVNRISSSFHRAALDSIPGQNSQTLAQ